MMTRKKMKESKNDNIDHKNKLFELALQMR